MNLIFSAAIAVCAHLSPADALDRHVYPLAPALTTPPVVIDVEDFPEGRAWAEKAKAVVETWYPHVTSLLATERFKPPKQIRLVFKKEISAPAWASGDTITVSGKWITSNPDDLGMMVHELVHVVQQYPSSRFKPGWLVEGIADYIRWWRYEPELHAGRGRTRIDPAKSKYTDAYRTTAMWLAWSARRYHMGLVPALDRALREAKDPMPVFKELTGKDADELWKEFIDAQG